MTFFAARCGLRPGAGVAGALPLAFPRGLRTDFIYIFKVRFALFDSNQYVALIFCGLIPFLGFSEALSAGVGSVTQNANLLKNTLFPIDLVPVKAVLVSQCTQVVGTGLLLITIILLEGKRTWWALLLPLAGPGKFCFPSGCCGSYPV